MVQPGNRSRRLRRQRQVVRLQSQGGPRESGLTQVFYP